MEWGAQMNRKRARGRWYPFLVSRYKIWHHWSLDPDRSADPESPRPALSHGYWVLKFYESELVGAALWRRRLEWRHAWPGLSVREAEDEYGGANMLAPKRGGRLSIGLKELPNLRYDDDPELLQALKVVEAREEIAGRLEVLTGKSLLDAVEPSASEAQDEADYFRNTRRWLEEATHALSYDGWTLEYVVDDELIAEVTRSLLKRLRSLLSGRRRA